MIEKVILDYMHSRGFRAYMEIPKDTPSHLYPFLVIEKTGASRQNRITTSTLAFQSYAESLYEAAAFNEQVKAAVEDSVMCREITRAAFQNDYNFTDTTTKRYRYQAVYDISHY